jgi:ligand-binding sensor domain-containing protein
MTRDNTNTGLPHNSITYVTVAPDGSKWVGTQMGSARLAGTAWTSFKGLAELGEIASEQVYSIFIQRPGTAWISAKGGAARYDGTSWKLYNKNNTTGIQTRYVYAVTVDKDGSAWFATQKGVSEMAPVPKDE